VSRPSLHDVPDLIDWHEGMLLTPRHFEQLTLRYEDLLQYGVLQSSPFTWGVRKLRIDTSKLLRGQFCVLELEAVMPDGLGVFFRTEEAEDLTCDLKALPEEARTQGAMVHLLVPASSDIRTGKELSRYVSYDEGIGDATEDEDESIPRLRPRLQLIAGMETVSAKYISLPIAKLEYRNEVYALADYMPPSAEVAIESSVGTLCSNTVRRIRERAVYLAQQLHTLSASGRKQFGELQRMRVRGMVTALPAIEALLCVGVANPFVLYTAYCSLAGQMSVLSETIVPPVFPPYKHTDILGSFRHVDRYLNAVLREGIPENYMPIPFTYHEGVFSLVFEPEWAKRRLILVLRFPPGTPQLDAIAWGEQCLIGSEGLQQSMRERRVLGAPRHYLQNEEGLVPSAGSVLFQLTFDPEYIHLNETLQVLGVSAKKDVRPSEIVLYVKTATRGDV
jgi:type VI secretion system protein ImpJ